jgi:hypothetical protein
MCQIPLALNCICLSLVFLAFPAHAQSGGDDVNEASVGLATFSYSSFLRGPASFQVLEVGYRRPLGEHGPWQWLRVGGGVRTGLTEPTSDVRIPAEVYAQLHLTARLGPWEVSAGPEVGVSGFARMYQRRIPAEDEDRLESARLSPFYFALGAAPLRLHYHRASVSFLEFHFGSSSFPPGNAVRLYLGLIRVGFEL